ncbi:hypothetical protein Caci_8551 [Catenulispora acidiphila DSM 44928]|uniref:Uncharacterized protein n=1 Tax=Catenulispora acidiphila (strain DSM 44928 / JCM 14897 / NBRC 102108 / NRRL B-24433 / ID139908) TaxID=479433 RepID=C7PYP9_CATAD|nr:hypothetical protein [Catenulispora acidiphila]ACU77371.1 hypothetical protein Caci_8551 [Catenulispora acidiphila DSM 44928]
MSPKSPDFEPGTVVRVRTEPTLSEVVLPATRQCEPPAEDLPELLICCTPVALVRTPVGIGVLRWVELRDLTVAEAEEPVDAIDRSADAAAS